MSVKKGRDVSGALIRDEAGRLLIGQRKKEDECGLLWEFPGGKCEPGETFEQCALREVKEELGVTIELLGVFATTQYRFNGWEITICFFDARLAAGEIPRPFEQEQLRWVKQSSLGEYEFMPPDYAVVQLLKQAN